MGTREVSESEIRAAQIAGRAARIGGAEHLCVRELGDGRAVYLRELLFDGLQVGLGRLGEDSYDEVWDYQAEQADDAWRAAIGWDGAGEPEGWYRHLRTGRRRPGGNASQQYVEQCS